MNQSAAFRTIITIVVDVFMVAVGIAMFRVLTYLLSITALLVKVCVEKKRTEKNVFLSDFRKVRKKKKLTKINDKRVTLTNLLEWVVLGLLGLKLEKQSL